MDYNELLRISKYQKDKHQEQLLEELNNILSPIEMELIKPFEQPEFPLLFIVGAPRSGSTLLSQLLASTGYFAYISNFVARFWMAPYLGSKIETSLGLREIKNNSYFSSTYGITEGWTEPHEFGYFWKRWFIFNESHKLDPASANRVNKIELQKEISSITALFQKPLFFKSLLCSLQISLLADMFEESFFLICKRKPIYQAQSLLLSRIEMYGDKNTWFSLRPREYTEIISLPYHEQVVAQIYYTLKDIEISLASIEASRFIYIDYRSLCNDPHKEIKNILKLIGIQNSTNYRQQHIPGTFKHNDYQRLPDEEWTPLQSACQLYFDQT